MKKSDKDFVDYLKNTLIPDLKTSGSDATAEDFERAVSIIEALDNKREPACGMYAISGTTEYKTNDGFCAPQFPTFYLHPEVQGISNSDTAVKIAKSLLNNTGNPDIIVHASAILVSVKSLVSED